MRFPHFSHSTRPARPAAPEWDLPSVPTPSVIFTEIRGLRGAFALSSSESRLRMFRRICTTCVRLVQACAESNGLLPVGCPQGEDVRRLVAHACVFGRLFARARLCRAD